MKGHSERVPGKNARPIAGKPLCFWMLEMLAEAPFVAQILVNTDSESLAEIVRDKRKVRVLMRPEEIQGDFVSMNRIIEHDLARAVQFEHFIQTHSTNPLLSLNTLLGAIALYETEDCDSVFSVTRHQARFYSERLCPINHNPVQLLRTQDLSPLYEENSNFYVFSRKSFEVANARIGSRPRVFEVPALEAVDIDTPEDWDLAELLLIRKDKKD